MKKIFLILTTILIFINAVAAQKTDSRSTEKPSADAVAANAAALELAKAAFAAHGGEKLHAVKTLVVRGSVDVTSAVFPQAIPGGFSMVFAGDKYRVELANPVQSFKQTFDGVETRTNIQGGVELPPLTRLGFPLLQRMGDTGFVVSSLPATAKKKLGFRMTAPDGFFTDFYVDEKTKQVKGYESQYENGGRIVTTSVEIEKYRTVEGVIVPEKYSQRFDLGQLVVYGDCKSKEILVNSPIADDVFKF